MSNRAAGDFRDMNISLRFSTFTAQLRLAERLIHAPFLKISAHRTSLEFMVKYLYTFS